MARPTVQLYLPDEYRQRAERLMALLEGRGVNLRDQRGVLSISAMFRYLVDEALNSFDDKPASAGKESDED